jgi:hypothetical protein
MSAEAERTEQPVADACCAGIAAGRQESGQVGLAGDRFKHLF